MKALSLSISQWLHLPTPDSVDVFRDNWTSEIWFVDFSSNHTKTQSVNQKIETIVLLWSSHMIKRSVNCKSLFTYHFFLPFQFLGQDSLLQLHFHILAWGSTPIFAKYFSSFSLHIRRLCLLRLCPLQGLRGAGWGAWLCSVSYPGFGDPSSDSHLQLTSQGGGISVSASLHLLCEFHLASRVRGVRGAHPPELNFTEHPFHSPW